MQHDVSRLMISRWPGWKDENEVQEATKLPLLLSRVMEGLPITSQSPFLALPLEVLVQIMALIADDRDALSTLALLNSDCRQLARSFQFVDVCFDYGPLSTKLLERLLDEAQARADAASDNANTLFIGSCIRRVTVNPKPQHVAATHKDLWDARGSGSVRSRQQMNDLRNNAGDDYLKNYRRPILTVLAQAMPNLDSLLWHDGMCLDIEVFKTLTRLPLQNLKFSGAYIGVPLSLEPPVVPQHMPLRSLSLGASPCIDGTHIRGGRAVVVVTSLTIKDSGPKAEFLGHENMVFPHLRYLDLASASSYPDAVAWSSFMAAPLKHLSLPLDGISSSQQFLSDCPTLEGLETLVVPSLYIEAHLAKLVVDFILKQSQVSKLSVQNGTPYFLDRHILPALASGKWSNLTSLSISWLARRITTEPGTNVVYTQIPSQSLAAINRIKSLEQLCLGADDAASRRHHWIPYHKDLRLRLQGLKNLRRLAFSGDTYKNPDKAPFSDLESYYRDRWLTQRVYDDAMERQHLDPAEYFLRPRLIHGAHATSFGDAIGNITIGEDAEFGSVNGNTDNSIPNDMIWERSHRNRMLREAEKYASVFRKLNWIFCGQLPISVKATEGSGEPVFEATPLSKRRDRFSSTLIPIFEMRGDA
ncbi:hypothetical protein TrVFT333_006643 [Trichoderma virens FT-333]|nr:hypothetical protein TrVFT333_006643 [Trichoderma virens FT-333]